MRFATAPALLDRDLSPFRASPPTGPGNIQPEPEEINRQNSELPRRVREATPPTGVVDHVVERWDGSERLEMPSPSASFAGVGNLDGVLPPDTEGDVGPSHYVQWVNLHFDIFDKTTGSSVIGGPVAGNALWSSLGGSCATSNDGDPIVLYDHLADRWLMTQFTGNNHECLAVSQGPNPATSGWYLYDFLMDVGQGYFPDYPKLGVWPDGYYYSANMFGSSFTGVQVAVFEREAMVAGNPGARVVWFFYDANVDWAWSLLPSDLDGPAGAAVGAPNPFITMIDNTWFSSGHNDELLLFDFSVDWSNTANSSFTGPTTINLTAGGLAFDSNLCNYAANCIPQPGTSRGLDTLCSRLMSRVQYRDFGDHESLLVSQSVDANGADRAGVRWYELRRSGGPWSVYQASTWAPDANNRWMGDLAMDAAGNIAVGYSVSSSSVYPSIRWAGRLAGDPLGSLSQGEATVIAGTGSQTSTYYRWGDYSSMSVDPVTDCTFWYTQEYMPSTSTAGWATRIAAFTFPPTAGPSTLTATVTGDNAVSLSWAPVGSATGYRVFRSMTSGTGYVQIATVDAPATDYLDNEVQGGVDYYWVVAAVAGCPTSYSPEATARPGGTCDLPPTFAGIVSAGGTAGSTCGIDLTWGTAGANCGGPVTYSVYRSTTTGFTPSASNRIAGGLTGTSYADANGVEAGTTYYYVVRATDEANGQEDGNTTEASSKPGIATLVTLYSNGFETGSGVSDWTLGTFVSGGSVTDWRGIQSCTANTGTHIFRFGGQNCTGNYASGDYAYAVPLGSGGIPVSAGLTHVTLNFAHRWQFETGYDGATLRVSLDGTNWTFVPASALSGTGYNGTTSTSCPPTGGGGRSVWTNTQSSFVSTTVDLDAVCNLITGGTGGCAGHDVRIAFTGITDCTNNFDGWFLDDVAVTAVENSVCTSTPSRVRVLTATATDGQVKLEWVNPSAPYASTRICRDVGTFPTDPTACSHVVANVAGSASAYDSTVDTGLSNGTTYSYAAFVDGGGGSWSGSREVAARPFDTSGKAKWSYHTSASALAPTGVMPGAIGHGAAYGVSNDRMLHAANPTTGGGDWPRTSPYGWAPMAMNGPAEARPPIVPTTAVPGATQVVFLGSEDGHAYAADAHTGTILWRSPELATMLLASPSGMFTDFGAPESLLVIGSRAATTGNLMYGLDPADGSVLWSFDNGGGANAIGIISSAATVDSGRIYFASRARAGGSASTVWCLQVSRASASLVWSQPYGNIDGAPVLYDGRLYVGNNDGRVYALDPTNGSEIWHYDTGDGPVKGFITPQVAALPRRLYLATSSTVWSLVDTGPSASPGWSAGSVASPSAPLAPFGGTVVYVGSSDGSLYQLDAATGGVMTSLQLGDGSGAIGSPARDVINGMAYVGSEAGAIYGVVLPLQ